MHHPDKSPNRYIKKFGEYLVASGRSQQTSESYGSDANQFMQYLEKVGLDPKQVEASTLTAYQDYLRETCKERENTVRRATIGVRQFYRFLSEQKFAVDSGFDDVIIPNRVELLPNIDYGQISAMIENLRAQCDDSFQAARNASILSLLGTEGIKATELIAMQWSDITEQYLRVRGTRARSISLHESTRACLDAYRVYFQRISDHPKIVEAKLDRVFVAFKGRDASVVIPKMSRHGLKFIVYEAGERFALKHLNSELLRHHAMQLMIANGRDVEQIMSHFGVRRAGNIGRHIAFARKEQMLSE